MEDMQTDSVAMQCLLFLNILLSEGFGIGDIRNPEGCSAEHTAAYESPVAKGDHSVFSSCPGYFQGIGAEILNSNISVPTCFLRFFGCFTCNNIACLMYWYCHC